jgi:GT2 family glycosyltransferase/tetratricopeptide (TPR) repeat protein
MIPALFQLGKARKASRRARRTNRAADWLAAVALWERIARAAPRSGRVASQYGHALRRSGRVDEALVAYEKALALKPDEARAWLGYGLALKAAGRRAAALHALTHALHLDPNLTAARQELIHYGARGLQQLGADRGTIAKDAFNGLQLSFSQAQDWLDDLKRITMFAPEEYARFRATVQVPEPPKLVGGEALPAIHVVIDAREASPAMVRTALQSLLRQGYADWRTTVLAGGGLSEHPVASLAAIDGRIAFAASVPAMIDEWTVILEAGVALHPRALAWFAWTAAVTGCVAAYGDHDHVRYAPDSGAVHFDPIFQPVYDRHWFSDGSTRPPALLVRDRPSNAVDIAIALREAGKGGAVAHIPLLLAAKSIKSPPRRPDHGATTASLRITVIVPTRDSHDLLERCIDRLVACADRPDLLDIRIMSNRPTLDASRAALARLERLAGVTILDFDEPFNWSRANNIAAEGSDADILLFLNDDTEMLTPGWDARLTALFADGGDVGAVGALLLYPGGGIQHAGVVMGLNMSGPQHEGRWQDDDAPGPAGRWTRTHACAAVTGAFMAMPAALFRQIGGFDERRFAIAYNDIDMCLRIREAGAVVLYTPDIRLVHHESVSRGSDVTPEMAAWDLGELESLHARWGPAIFHDPGYNPHYVDHGYPFDGYRQPSQEEAADHVRHSAVTRPWRAIAADAIDAPQHADRKQADRQDGQARGKAELK